MASRPPRFWDVLTDFDLTQIVLSLLAFARSQEEANAILMGLRKLGESNVQALQVLSGPHGELSKAVLQNYESSKEAYRKATKMRRLLSFGLRAEELERESHQLALRDTQELFLSLSLPSQPEAGRILRENRATVAALREALLAQLSEARQGDIQGGLVRRVFDEILGEGEDDGVP